MTPDFGDALFSPAHWAVLALTVTVVGAVVGIHFEALSWLNRRLPQLRIARYRVVALIYAVLAVHAVEIWIFGVALWAALRWPALGVVADGGMQLLDAVYISTEMYTTVGYGDFPPQGPIRLLLGFEALTGFVLIAWTASFTYLEMERDWRRH